VRRRGWLLVLIPFVVVTMVLGDAMADEIGDGDAAHVATPSPAGSLVPLPPVRKIVLGSSVDGRPIVAFHVGNPKSGRPVLVVGCIHGDEPAGIAIARDLVSDPPPTSEFLWVIPVLNPDGLVAHTRQNAHGVDLNRNFPYRWRPLTGVFDSGPRPLSEPETRIARRFILHRRPVISIWFHQHRDLVDRSGGSVAVERSYARMVHLPLVRLPRYPGSATRWENHVMTGTTAFVVELPGGRLSHAEVERYSDAILRLMQPAS
jgi:murein peptide amidase A